MRSADTRRLCLFVAAIVFVDTAFYAVVAPGGGLAKVVGDIAPLLAVAAVCATTLALVLRASCRTPAAATGSDWAALRPQTSPAVADRDPA